MDRSIFLFCQSPCLSISKISPRGNNDAMVEEAGEERKLLDTPSKQQNNILRPNSVKTNAELEWNGTPSSMSIVLAIKVMEWRRANMAPIRETSVFFANAPRWVECHFVAQKSKIEKRQKQVLRTEDAHPLLQRDSNPLLSVESKAPYRERTLWTQKNVPNFLRKMIFFRKERYASAYLFSKL